MNKNVLLLICLCVSMQSFAQQNIGEPMKFDAQYDILEGYGYKVTQNGKFGYLYYQDIQFLPCIYDDIIYIPEYWFIVILDGKQGLFKAIPNRYDRYASRITEFKEVVPAKYDRIYFASEKIELCVVEQNGKKGLFSMKDGREIVPCEYDQLPAAGTYSGRVGNTRNSITGVAVIGVQNGKSGVLNSEGKTVVPCQYDAVKIFYDGDIALLQNGKLQFFNIIDLKIVKPSNFESKNFDKEYKRRQKNGTETKSMFDDKITFATNVDARVRLKAEGYPAVAPLINDAGNSRYAYWFDSDSTFRLKKHSITDTHIGNEKLRDSYKEDRQFNLLSFYRRGKIDPSEIEKGYFTLKEPGGGLLNKSVARTISIPKEFLEKRQQLYKPASTGTIYDLLKYESVYGRYDLNMARYLKARKDSMLYTTHFFDDASEKYKFDFYSKSYTAISDYTDRKTFALQYVNYDPSSHVQSLLNETPLKYLDSLIKYESICDEQAYYLGIAFLGHKHVGKKDYEQDRSRTQEAISECSVLLSSAQGKCREHVNAMHSKLKNHLSYIEQQYSYAVEGASDFNAAAGKKAAAEQAVQCANCIIDKDKSKFPTAVSDDYTQGKPGKIVMKNGTEFEYYKSPNGKWYIVGSFIFNTRDEFDSFESLIGYFLRKCEGYYCR